MSTGRQLAPDFELVAVTSRRKVCRATCAGRPLVLLFHDQDGLSAVRVVQDTLRKRWPRAEQVLIASVINLQPVPSFLRNVVEKMMGLAFREAARQLPPGTDPTDYVLILPDHTGRVSHALNVFDGGKAPCVLVFDGQWNICARLMGDGLSMQCMVALEPLLDAARP